MTLDTETDNSSLMVNIPFLKTFITDEIHKIIKTISNEYQLNENDINSKILDNNWCINFNSLIENQNKKKRPINPVNYCIARKPNLKQCTRNKKNDSDYCANHQYNRPNGRIDEEIKSSHLNIKDNLDKRAVSNFIKLKPITLFNQNYFIDINNHLYIKDDIIDKYRYIGIFDLETNNIKLKN
jgi:hypothetical protein